MAYSTKPAGPDIGECFFCSVVYSTEILVVKGVFCLKILMTNWYWSK